MNIVVYDWGMGRLLSGTPYTHNQIIEGTLEDAVQIAGEIFLKGPNVMLVHTGGTNTGTRKKPVISPKGILIAVDDRRFQQR